MNKISKLPKLLFKGGFAPEDIKIKYDYNSSRKILPGLEQKLGKQWKKIEKDAKEKGKKIWDADIYRFEDFSLDKGKLELELSTVRFSTIKAMNFYIDDILRLGESYFSRGIFIASLVETADGKFVFGKTGKKYLSSHKYNFLGGVLSKSEKKISTGSNLFEQLYREFSEEMNVDNSDIAECTLAGGFQNSRLKVCLFFETKLEISSDIVRQRFDKQNDGEFEKIVFVDTQDIGFFLSRSDWFGLELKKLFL